MTRPPPAPPGAAAAPAEVSPSAVRATLAHRYAAVRGATEALAAPLPPEDQLVQSMPDASPTKWHLAHTTWFFEAFVLSRHAPGYVAVDERYTFLFNSYYEGVGPRQPRPRRAAITRPTLPEVRSYRKQVDARVQAFLGSGDAPAEACDRIELGLHHEQQHQELILTDIHHALWTNPLRPAYGAPAAGPGPVPATPGWSRHPGGPVEIGHHGDGFSFDNERPRHRLWLEPFALADRPVSAGEYLAFMEDGGYRRPELWLSDGWAALQEQGWTAPLYWQESAEGWTEFTLAGTLPLDTDAPASHVSYYEAEAYARWAGARLPTEAEWEVVAEARPLEGNLLDSGALAPRPDGGGSGPRQVFGDVWEWTASAYLPYPRFRPLEGDLGEYNGKFMSGQMVLRGGSCFTPRSHLRPSYRNFFPPAARWQMSGIRLARWE